MEPVTLNLGPQGQKQYRLVFDNAAAFAFEEEYRRRFGREKGVFQFFTECAEFLGDALQAQEKGHWTAMRGPSLSEVVLAIWALANTHHVKPRRGPEALTIEKLQGEVNPAEYAFYVGFVAQVLQAGMPQGKEDAPAKAGQSAPLAAT